jgi:nitroreductase
MDLIQSLNWRYATKRFDPNRKISDADFATLKQSMLLAPSSFGLQPWKFLVVQNPDLRIQLREATWSQSQVTDCSHYVVFTYLEKVDPTYIEKYVERVAQVRGVELKTLDGYKKSMVDSLVTGPRSATIEAWAQRQTYIAFGFLLESAALLNIDACPIEGLEPAKYDKILKIEGTGHKTVATVALGYRHPEDNYSKLKKVRFSEADLIQTI